MNGVAYLGYLMATNPGVDWNSGWDSGLRLIAFFFILFAWLATGFMKFYYRGKVMRYLKKEGK